MYFHESEAIAREHSALQRVIEQIDGHLATIFNPAPLRPADFSSVLSCDANQVVSIFDLLAQREVLLAEGMVECDRCHNLMPASAYDEAMADEDDFECLSCHRSFGRRVRRTTVYRMTAETLARPRPAVATAERERSSIDKVRKRVSMAVSRAIHRQHQIGTEQSYCKQAFSFPVQRQVAVR